MEPLRSLPLQERAPEGAAGEVLTEVQQRGGGQAGQALLQRVAQIRKNGPRQTCREYFFGIIALRRC